MEMAVKIAVSSVLVILTIIYAPQSDDGIPQIGSNRLEAIHKALAISLSAQDFSRECTRLARKPPKWFVARLSTPAQCLPISHFIILTIAAFYWESTSQHDWSTASIHHIFDKAH